jgi:hypothetical protein
MTAVRRTMHGNEPTGKSAEVFEDTRRQTGRGVARRMIVTVDRRGKNAPNPRPVSVG